MPRVYYESIMSLSARRAWIEMVSLDPVVIHGTVALRKESVDRNGCLLDWDAIGYVALRKESVDRNSRVRDCGQCGRVALRKESVDRNVDATLLKASKTVALRKESVDRNVLCQSQRRLKQCRSPQGERG